MFTSKKLLREITTTSSSLPEEIISDILLRVSAKDLARFRSVSKSWLSLISNPSFIEAFFACSQEEIIFTITKKSISRIKTQFVCSHFSLKYLQNNMSAKNLEFPVKQGVEQKELRLMSACNGLLLFRHIYDPNQIYISNPVTAHFVALPPTTYFRAQWALVHDASIGKFKVYGICTKKKFLSLTQGESNWVEADIPTTTIRGQLGVLTQLIVVNNELHWLSIDVDHDADGAAANQRYRPMSYYIFSIHIETGVIKRTKVPPYLANPDLLLRIKCCKGSHRHLLSRVKDSLSLTIVSCNQLEMFLLEDKLNGVWIKTRNVCLQSLLIGKPSTFLESFLSNEVCLVPSREITGSSNELHLWNILIHHEDHLFFCDLKSLQWRNIAFLPKGAKLSRLYEYHCNSLTSSWD